MYLKKKKKKLIDRNQELLNEIGVGHHTLDEICNISSSFGFHSKLTGAGGGGCAYVLIPNQLNAEKELDLNNLKNELKKKGYYYFETTICGEGLKILK